MAYLYQKHEKGGEQIATGTNNLFQTRNGIYIDTERKCNNQ